MRQMRRHPPFFDFCFAINLISTLSPDRVKAQLITSGCAGYPSIPKLTVRLSAFLNP